MSLALALKAAFVTVTLPGLCVGALMGVVSLVPVQSDGRAVEWDPVRILPEVPEDGVITLRVLDADELLPLDKAVARLPATDEAAHTNGEGLAQFLPVPVGVHEVHVQAPGYAQTMVEVEATPCLVTNTVVKLEPLGHPDVSSAWSGKLRLGAAVSPNSDLCSSSLECNNVHVPGAQDAQVQLADSLAHAPHEIQIGLSVPAYAHGERVVVSVAMDSEALGKQTHSWEHVLGDAPLILPGFKDGCDLPPLTDFTVRVDWANSDTLVDVHAHDVDLTLNVGASYARCGGP